MRKYAKFFGLIFQLPILPKQLIPLFKVFEFSRAWQKKST